MRSRWLRLGVSLLLLVASAGCALIDERPRFSFTPQQFREELWRRVPELAGQEIEVPFELDEDAIALARRTMLATPRGPQRIQAVVRMLHQPPPEGFGLRYRATASQTASETLERREGNCVSLASVMVGVGRGLGWPIYYGEALVDDEEIMREADLAIRADHMVVVIVAHSVRAVIDFTGPVEGYGVRVIDDIQAYAHLLNNRASDSILRDLESDRPPNWELALEGFSLATRVTPQLARAWNNQGVALARLGRLEDARRAYDEALRSGRAPGSTEHNLIVLETRSRGETSIGSTP